MADRFVRSGDVELWTEGIGDPGHSPILLVMGSNASAMQWPDELIALIVKGGRYVIRYDHRDTGKSTRRNFMHYPYSLEDLAADAVAVLDGHGIEAAHVVGMSMGGSIGQILAVDHRRRLRTLTVMMTAALDVDFVGNFLRALAGKPSPDGLPTPDARAVRFLSRRREPPVDRAAEIARRVEDWRVLAGDELPFHEEEFGRWEARVIDHAGTLEQPSAHGLAKQFPVARGGELRGVTTPTLVIQGMRDPLDPPPHGRHIAELIPGARLVEIPGLGHALPTVIHRQIADLVLEHTGRAG